MFPGGIALVIDCLSENKLRALQEVKAILTRAGAQASPTSYLFSKKGIILVSSSESLPYDTILETALEIPGVEDISEPSEDGGVEITTDPTKAFSAAAELRQKLSGIELASSDVVWVPNGDTMVDLEPDSRKAKDLDTLVEQLEEYPSVEEVYTNVRG